jgi:outer membrane receptor protein involved in Fe transport
MINYELSYTKKIKKFNFGANIYYIKGDNLITTVPRTDGAGKINMNTGEFENKGFELSAAYKYGAWKFSANYSYLDMDIPVTGAPENKIYFAVQYTNGNFSAKISEQSITGLYISTGNNAETEDYNLINANVSYKLLPWLKLFVKGENLLNQEYHTYAGFTMPKATFMGGICINL